MSDQRQLVKSRQVIPHILIVDVWRKDNLTQEKLAAYKYLQSCGEISVRKVLFEKCSGKTVIEYFSNTPKEWTHQLLQQLSSPLSASEAELDRLLNHAPAEELSEGFSRGAQNVQDPSSACMVQNPQQMSMGI